MVVETSPVPPPVPPKPAPLRDQYGGLSIRTMMIPVVLLLALLTYHCHFQSPLCPVTPQNQAERKFVVPPSNDKTKGKGSSTAASFRQAMRNQRNSLGGPGRHGDPVGTSQGQENHDPMRSAQQHSLQDGMPRQFMQQPPPPVQPQQQQIPQQHQQQHNSWPAPPPSAYSSGTWQESERDTPDRREMIQQMYVFFCSFVLSN
jgi:hypothetical protein